MAFLRVIDLVLLALALPVFLVAGWPILGWLTGAAVWGMWRGIGAYADRKASQTRDPRQVAGIAAGSMIGRGWIMGLTILAVGLTDNRAGLSAAVLAVACFTLWFSLSIVTRPLPDKGPRS